MINYVKICMTVITYLFPAFVVSGGAWHMGWSGMQCQKTPAPKSQTLPDICVWSCTTSDSSRYHFLSSTSSGLPCFCRTRPRTRRKEPSVAKDNLPVSIKSVRNFYKFQYCRQVILGCSKHSSPFCEALSTKNRTAWTIRLVLSKFFPHWMHVWFW